MTPAKPPRLYLSPPYLGSAERDLVAEALDSNWIAPLGPHVDAFEREFAAAVGAPYATAVSSGTAALHMALILAGLTSGEEVLVSTLTFSASVNPIVYLGGRPVFIDSEIGSWNMDPELLCHALATRAARGRLPRAVIPVHLYGQAVNIGPILEACARYGVPVIEDAAESLGATYEGRSPGTFGRAGIFSFNGNKIITTSGGGMIVSSDEALIVHARKLSSQARDPAPHYEHSEIGYNYRMSNILAAIGRGQLRQLAARVASRRRIFDRYREALDDVPGIQFMPEASWGRHSRWLTTLTVSAKDFGATSSDVIAALENVNIEARPVWKPMHLQPIFRTYESVGGSVSERLFMDGICLPSGSQMTDAEIDRVVTIIRGVAGC